MEKIHSALEQARKFSRSAGSPLLLLADLGEALPDGGALTALTLDSSTVTLSIAVPRATLFVETLDRLPSVRSPRISGPILRQAVGDATFERATIEFSLSETAENVPAHQNRAPDP